MHDPHIADYHDFSYDESFVGIPYSPWVGRDYQKQQKRILIVPESVYDWDQGSSVSKESLSKAEYVRHCVRQIGLHFTMVDPWKGSDTQKMYRGIERLMWNAKAVTRDQKLKLWNAIAFHELVQRPMENQDARPNRKDLQDGAKILFKVIQILRPDLCVFLGTDHRKMRALEEEFKVRAEWAGHKINGAYPKTISLAPIGIQCSVVMVKHPSERFSWNRWADYLTEKSSGIVSAFRSN